MTPKDEKSEARKYLDDVFNRLFEEKDPKVIKNIGKIKHRIDKRDFRKESHKKKVLEDVYGIQKQENCGICGEMGGAGYDLEKMWKIGEGRKKLSSNWKREVEESLNNPFNVKRKEEGK